MPNNIIVIGSKKPTAPRDDGQFGLRSPMPERGELSCIDNYNLGTVNSIINISNKPCQCRSPGYWADDTLGE